MHFCQNLMEDYVSVEIFWSLKIIPLSHFKHIKCFFSGWNVAICCFKPFLKFVKNTLQNGHFCPPWNCITCLINEPFFANVASHFIHWNFVFSWTSSICFSKSVFSEKLASQFVQWNGKSSKNSTLNQRYLWWAGSNHPIYLPYPCQ